MTASQPRTTLKSVGIRKAALTDIAALNAIADAMRSAKELDYFQRNLAQQEEGSRELFIASLEGQDVAYCIMNWEPKYGFFKSQEIPEIQDLNVLPSFRRRGIATLMIRHCEELARLRGKKTVGISVGLDPGYGAAQVLYAKLGYIPDGYGITYDRKTVSFGEFRPVDDNLCLMMVKSL